VIIEHLDGARGLAGWRWLLLIGSFAGLEIFNHLLILIYLEGVGASFVGCFTWMILPDWPSSTPWLTPEEKVLLPLLIRSLF
jgi:hypothetical protein